VVPFEWVVLLSSCIKPGKKSPQRAQMWDWEGQNRRKGGRWNTYETKGLWSALIDIHERMNTPYLCLLRSWAGELFSSLSLFVTNEITEKNKNIIFCSESEHIPRLAKRAHNILIACKKILCRKCNMDIKVSIFIVVSRAWQCHHIVQRGISVVPRQSQKPVILYHFLKLSSSPAGGVGDFKN